MTATQLPAPPPQTAPPQTALPLTAPSLTAPPLTAPSQTAPSQTAPPLTAPAERPVRTTSLRRRVVLSVLSLLLVVLAALGLTVNYLLQTSLRADLRQRLVDRAGYAAVLQEEGVSGQSLADRLTGQGVGAVFSSDAGQFFGRPGAAPPPGRFGQPGPGALPRPDRSPRISMHDSDGNLTATVTLASGTLTLTTSEDGISRTMQELKRSELIAAAVTLAIAAFFLVWVVREALRPLERMTSLAGRIRDGARGSRLRPTKPKTELGRTAAAFDAMLDALESAESEARTAQTASEQAELRMRQFLGDASHDLRTPLAGMIASAEQLLRDQGPRELRERRLVELIRQARRASRLVDDLLMMTRLAAPESGGQPAPPFELVDLAAIAAHEVESLGLRRADLHVSGPAATPCLVRADAGQLHRAVANLLDNAATASQTGGQVSVSLDEQAGLAQLAVRDQGPGVAPGDRERIFDRFVRLSQSRAGSGTGLGLPIARGIARGHGGDVVCCPVASGALFVLSVPTAAVVERAVAASRS